MQMTKAVKHTRLKTRLSGPEGRSARACVKASHVSDIMQSGLAVMSLVLLAPLFVIICPLIKFTSQGPMLYRGLRVGNNGRILTIYKFRTLHVDAEQKSGAQLLTDNDASYTCIGKFLKRTKLDELPQLMNVLKGEMNFVGLRPTRPIFLEKLCDHSPCYPIHFFAMKPRTTGVA
jgi:lipopolysaccharide/colanic/teichoic acid biosynthesis glycosyltransferase